VKHINLVSNLLQIELNQGFSIWKRSCGYILGFKLPNNNKVKIQAFKKKNNNNKLPENNKVRFKLQKQQRQQKFKLPNNTRVRFKLPNNNKIRFKLQEQQQKFKP